MQDNNNYMVQDNIIEIPLSGEKLPVATSSLDIINRYGNSLFSNNSKFIREKISDTWFIVIEPISGSLIASSSPIKAYQYASEKYPGRLMYVVGLLRDNPINFVFDYV